MQNQEQEDALSRCLKQPINSVETLNLSIDTPEPNKAVRWDETGTKLVSTEYDLEAMAEEASGALTRATAALSAAEIAVSSATEASEAAAQASRDVAAASAAIVGVAETAQNYAVGTIAECPEGSAKWWAQQTQQTVQMTSYTKNETDALLIQKADTFTPASPLEFVTENSVKKLKINDTTLSGTYATKEYVTGVAATKQDALTEGTGIDITEGVISVDLSDVAYTKNQTDALLNTKQDTLTAGNYISISSGVIDVDTDTLIQGFTEEQWEEKSASEKAAIKLAVIYEE